jgi:hypothetical protein
VSTSPNPKAEPKCKKEYTIFEADQTKRSQEMLINLHNPKTNEQA